VGLAALGTSALAFGWGMARSRHEFTLEEVVVRIPGLPPVLDGYTLVQVSDIHAGLFVGDRDLVEGLSRVLKVRADVLVFTGDIVDFDVRYAPHVARALMDFGARARDGVVAVLGNHDYYAGAPAVTAAMRAAGIDVLVNAGKTLRPNESGGIALLGVDDLWAKRAGGPGPMLDAALTMVPPDAPRILLAHNPNCIDFAAGNVALQLSGHMHGGQINPGVHVASIFARYVAGRYERKGTTLWVNRGFGVTGPPVRLDAPPEVTKVVLVGA
jgi:predicted MPP superfamily phosphohydrolase